MRVLIAPQAFTGHLSAQQAADAIASGWAEQAPDDVLTCCPLSDGGAGFIDVVLAARGGDLVPVTVSGPLGEPVPATLLSVTERDGSRTTYVESEQACGAHLMAGQVADAWRATSVGVGELVRAAAEDGARRVVVGVGDSACHDGGAGLLSALGVGAAQRLAGGGGSLSGLAPDDLAGLADARERLRGADLVVATASNLPLLGFHGASATDAVRRGATVEQAQELEAALGHFADVSQRALVAGRLVGGSGLAASAGAGAGGGIGFALLLLGARRVDGVLAVLEATRFAERLRQADLVVSGEAVLDWESMRAGVVNTIAGQALGVGVPVVVLAGRVEVGRRELLNLGVSSAYQVSARTKGPVDPAAGLQDRARRVARTWSR